MQHLFNKIKSSRMLHWVLILLLVNLFVCYVYYLYICQTKTLSSEVAVKWIPFNSDKYHKFLINNSECRIPDLDPWNEEARLYHERRTYKSCTKKPLLTQILKREKRAYLTINKAAVRRYCRRKLSCCYSTVIRDTDADVPDNSVNVSRCLPFTDEAQIENDVILVECHCKSTWSQTKVYSNTHAVIYVTEELEDRKKKLANVKPPSVLFVGMDSVSRLNLIRTLPSTLEYVTSKNWTNFQVYNKVGLNTFPNLMAIFTGLNLSMIYKKTPFYKSFFDVHDAIWKDYERLGYVTSFAEDLAEYNTFNYNKRGFYKQPMDFYFRHYTIISEQLTIQRDNGAIYCTGPEVAAMRVLNVAGDFARTFRDQPSFGFFWMNGCSHDNLNSPRKLDEKLVEFFRNLEDYGVLNNTILIFLSDHGYRFGDFRLTTSGWLEDMMPSLFVWLPESFRQIHAEKYQTFQRNSRRLTTTFDLHMTLQDILILSGLNYTSKPIEACPKCGSLFSEIADVRSCQDAGISVEWCPCISYREFGTSGALIRDVAYFVVGEMERIMYEISPEAIKCAPLKLKRVLRSRISDRYERKSYVMLMFETETGMLFQAIVRLEYQPTKTMFFLEGEADRIDLYKYTSTCTSTGELKKYCYCKSHLSFLSWLTSW